MAPASLLVLGGNGRLADALRRYLPDGTRYAARTAIDPRCIAVGDYGAAPPALFAGTQTVINCAGITAGDAATLHRANVEGAAHVAASARAAGARRFVHVSSFSVLGRARHIDAHTPAAPVSDYGRSKLAAEEALLALATRDFAVVPVRLPAIVGGGSRDKLRQLIALWLRVRRLPVPRTPVQRSMISIDLAAQVLAQVACGEERGVLHAADRSVFTYRDAAAAIADGTRRTVGTVALPDALIAPLERVAPGLFTSLYAPSVLDPMCNQAARLPSDLYQTIARMAQQEKLA